LACGAAHDARCDGPVRACREVRWFVDDEVPASLVPSDRPQRRADCYDVDALRPWTSVKRRRGCVLERKLRIGRVELVTVAGVVGFAETWQKQRVRDRVVDEEWLEVRKHVWTRGEVEIARVEVAGIRSWTICIDVTRPPSAAGRDALHAWRVPLQRHGQSSGYPAWLAERFALAAGTAAPPDRSRCAPV
jgi:hypothetical protein